MSRKNARELVLHLTFGSEYTGYSGEDILKSALTEENFNSLKEECALYKKMPPEKQTDYVTRATQGIVSHMQELDGYIEKYSKGWNVGRISRVAKSILRLSMYETLYMDIPIAASVNEAVELTKAYDSEEAGAFVNGVLSSFVKNEPVK